ncbi:unnamed protein product [Rhizoctonia solani]|uniref:Zn(2)-C6 fungal-type domain-containing protein n=1 Tax=Rhizoctonia solani TaxID=456999 RepID=A0A8H2WXN8_9AGAM|nr:unnamed protein product [Rhizoctonia solani]
MMRSKSKPGPRPTSCLTCQKRRKKCDLGRPFCGRCLKGGFECLGYKYSGSQEGTQREDDDTPTLLQLPPASMIVPVPPTGSESIYSNALNGDSGQSPSPLPADNRQHTDGIHTSDDPAPSIFGSALVYSMVKLVPRDNENHTVDDYNRSWLHSQQLTTYGRARTRRLLEDRNLTHTASSTQSVKNLQVIIQALCTSIPPSVDATQVMREEHFGQIIHEYHLQRAGYWFTLPPFSTGSLFQRKSSIWVMYLGARLFQALGGNPHATTVMVPRCINWIDKLEQKFAFNFRNSSSLNDAAEWLLTQLELVFLRFTAIGSGSGYLALKKALPVFLRLVAVDSSLHIEHPRGDLVISFPRTFGAPRYELQWFLVNDTITPLLLGAQPLVEYGYEIESNLTSHSLEWIHGIPVALVEAISQVNSWRAGSRVAPLDDWRNLERRVLAWHSSLTVAEGQESGANITARFAIQEGWRHVTLIYIYMEGWRHVTLIYIYMGMCGVSSHDPRVQASISRIMQLGEAVNNLPIGVHVFVHCVVVGLAARYERHRSIVHEKLLSFTGTRVWLFHGSEFGRILEHLWYGVGAGGAAVTWDDYVRSRCAVVPI